MSEDKRYADKDFVETVVKELVDHPEDVRADRSVDEMGVLLTLYINPADMGQIIGRNGRTARAIRTLLRVVGAKHNARVNLKIHEPEGSRQMRAASATRVSSNDDRSDDDRDDTEVDDLDL